MVQPNPALYPPLGYVFTDTQSGQEFAGADWDDLAQQIENYRRANGIPVGKPLEECHRAYCQRHPRFCSDPSRRVTVSVSSPSLGRRVVAWVAKLFGSMPVPVDQQTAEARASICSRCPQQTEWRASCGCSIAAVKAIKRDWLRSARRKPTKKTEGLKACEVLGEECSFSVWAEQKVKDSGQPRSCWRLVK